MDGMISSNTIATMVKKPFSSSPASICPVAILVKEIESVVGIHFHVKVGVKVLHDQLIFTTLQVAKQSSRQALGILGRVDVLGRNAAGIRLLSPLKRSLLLRPS